MPINENELTKEMVAKAMKCETAEDLIALAKAEGIDLTKEEAEAYMAELADVELDEEVLQKVAGGKCWDINHRLTLICVAVALTHMNNGGSRNTGYNPLNFRY